MFSSREICTYKLTTWSGFCSPFLRVAEWRALVKLCQISLFIFPMTRWRQCHALVPSQALHNANYFPRSCFRCTVLWHGLSLGRLGLELLIRFELRYQNREFTKLFCFFVPIRSDLVLEYAWKISASDENTPSWCTRVSWNLTRDTSASCCFRFVSSCALALLYVERSPIATREGDDTKTCCICCFLTKTFCKVSACIRLDLLVLAAHPAIRRLRRTWRFLTIKRWRSWRCRR
jgi:hypothetical protein